MKNWEVKVMFCSSYEIEKKSIKIPKWWEPFTVNDETRHIFPIWLKKKTKRFLLF